MGVSRKKREYKKRKHKDGQQTFGHTQSTSVKYPDIDGSCGLSGSSEDEILTVSERRHDCHFMNRFLHKNREKKSSLCQ